MRSNLTNDPDVIAVAADLSIDEFSVVGRLHAFWSWADQHSADGTLPRATSAFVDRLTACPGFAEALRRVGWLDGRDSALILPNWERHNGETAKGRAVAARRQKKHRSVTDVTTTVTGEPLPEKRRVEKIRTSDTNVSSEGAALPHPSPDFAAAWADWLQHRREIKKSVTPTQSIAQLQKLGSMKEKDAISTIRNTIEKGWQGLREPETVVVGSFGGKSQKRFPDANIGWAREHPLKTETPAPESLGKYIAAGLAEFRKKEL